MSIGLNLISGEIMEGFTIRFYSINVTSENTDYSFTLSPLIMPKSGLARLDTYIRTGFEDDMTIPGRRKQCCAGRMT